MGAGGRGAEEQRVEGRLSSAPQLPVAPSLPAPTHPLSLFPNRSVTRYSALLRQ